MMVSRYKEYKKDNLIIKILTTQNYSENYVLWLKDKKTNKFLEEKKIKFNKSKIEKFIKNCFKSNNILLFGIFYNSTHIGNIKVDFDNINYNCTIGYILGEKKFLGKGITHKSLRKVIDFLFNKLNIRIISTEVLNGNIKSIKLLKRNKFKKIYILKKRVFLNKKILDVIGFQLLNKKTINKIFSTKLNFSNKNYKLNVI